MALSELTSGRLEWTVDFLRALVETFRAAHVPFLAASIAYSAFVSLLPLLVLTTLLASVIGGEAFAGTVVGLTEQYLSPTGQDILAGTLERAAAQTGLSLLSVLVFLWATLRLFRALDLAFSLLYGTEEQTDLVGQLIDGTVVIAAMGLAVVGTVGAMVVFAMGPDVPRVAAVEKLGLVAFLTIALLPLYYVFPDEPVSIRDVLPGTVIGAGGWTLLEIGFEVYVGLTSTTELYGVIGGVILLVTWMYFGALTILLGATVNVVLTKGPPSGPDPVPV